MQNVKEKTVVSPKNATNEVAGNQAQTPARSVESIRRVKARLGMNMCCTSGSYK
jgi:hypothetical protein